MSHFSNVFYSKKWDTLGSRTVLEILPNFRTFLMKNHSNHFNIGSNYPTEIGKPKKKIEIFYVRWYVRFLRRDIFCLKIFRILRFLSLIFSAFQNFRDFQNVIFSTWLKAVKSTTGGRYKRGSLALGTLIHRVCQNNPKKCKNLAKIRDAIDVLEQPLTRQCSGDRKDLISALKARVKIVCHYFFFSLLFWQKFHFFLLLSFVF